MVIWLVFSGIITWRLTRMLYNENGPLDIFARLRSHLATRQKRMGGMYDMISCFYCLSFWVAIPIAATAYEKPTQLIFNSLIISSIAIFLQTTIIKLER